MSVNVNSRWYNHDPYVYATQADKVFYLDDPKLGHPWKVVQKIQYRHIWDVLEREDEDEAPLEEDGSEQESDEESDEEVDEISNLEVQVDDEESGYSLRREDVEPEIITLSMGGIEKTVANDIDYNGDDNFIDDDVLMEDVISSGEDEVSISSEDDSDN